MRDASLVTRFWRFPFLCFAGCFLDLVRSPWITAWERISKTLQTWALKVSECLIFNYISYITVWWPSVLGACCVCFSGSVEGYRKLYDCLISESFDKLTMLRLAPSQEIKPLKWNLRQHWTCLSYGSGLCLNPHFLFCIFLHRKDIWLLFSSVSVSQDSKSCTAAVFLPVPPTCRRPGGSILTKTVCLWEHTPLFTQENDKASPSPSGHRRPVLWWSRRQRGGVFLHHLGEPVSGA